MPRTKEQCAELREQMNNQIKEAGIKVFAYRGYAATKIGDIAKEAGISIGLLYHYFSSKEELFLHLVQETVEMSNQGLMYFETLELAPKQKIMALAQMVTGEILSDEKQAPRFMMMVQAGLYSGDIQINQSMYGVDNIPIEVTARLIQAAQKEGIAKEGDPYELAVIFWATVQGLCMQRLVTQGAFSVPTTEMMSQLILK